MNYRIGQKVVCIHRGKWVKTFGLGAYETTGPKFNEVVTIKGQCDTYHDCVDIIEYLLNPFGIPQSFMKNWFRPVQDHSASVSIELIQSLPETIREGLDVPLTVETTNTTES